MNIDEINRLSYIVVGICIDIHKEVGPGLLESVYEVILYHELMNRGISCRRQVSVPIAYNGLTFQEGYRIDVLVEECLILEIKAVEKLAPSTKSQLFTYLKFKNLHLGMILNFGGETMKEGIHRVVHGPPPGDEDDSPISLH